MNEAVIIPVGDRDLRGQETEPFNPALISASRVNSFLTCGVAFKMHYVDGIKEQRSGSAALFGNVIHTALEWWTPDKSQDLVTLTAKAWMENTKRHKMTQDFIKAYQGISVKVMKAEADAKAQWEKANPGKESKAPRMTAIFKKSPAALELNKLLGKWIPKLSDAPWQFNERDPLPALYDESLQVAARYARKYGTEPASIHTEFGFLVKWKGFLLRGYIDGIFPLLDEDGVLIGYLILDYKTYRAEAAPMKDWRQGVMYDVAVTDLVERGVLELDPSLPRYVVFDYVRLLKRKDFLIGKADHLQLFKELTTYKSALDAQVFLPAHKGTNPDYCGYPDNCCMLTKGEGVGCSGGIYEVS